jgi:uncharacterized iron-regulated protein
MKFAAVAALLPAPVAALLLASVLACAGGGAGPFTSPRQVDHPLVGRIWSQAEEAALDWDGLARRAGQARFVLLGEIHDNADHHRLQARLIARLAAGPRPPAVVFEMLDRKHQEAIDAFLAGGMRDPDALAVRVGWAESGWPDFALYRPVFAAALDAGLPILAAGLRAGVEDRDEGPEWQARFGLTEPLPPEQQFARIEEMFTSHCELIPREQLDAMVEMQRARDARMADALLRGAEARGRAVLIAGAGHTLRAGVPALLERAGVASGAILSVGFLEVDPQERRIEQTEASEFDLVVFTPAAEREDPCERLRRRLDPGS